MFHSSIFPISLPISVLIGVMSFHALQSCGMDVGASLLGAKICTGLVNAMVGIPKNILTGDILSLIVVRPVSLLAAVEIVAHVAHLA